MELGFGICASSMKELFMVTVFEQAKGNHNLQALFWWCCISLSGWKEEELPLVQMKYN